MGNTMEVLLQPRSEVELTSGSRDHNDVWANRDPRKFTVAKLQAPAPEPPPRPPKLRSNT